ncbi:MAG TPA: XRE family transcriptional regulator [Gammaproteobacteria bacterium]|nr:XRE family transcriptional regulator [Gammaproteobacteria bacterium]
MTKAAEQAAEPLWVGRLRSECIRRSQARVARDLGYSAAVINQALKGTYRGDLTRLREVVEGRLMGATVDCPVLGDMPRDVCLDNQRRPFAATNPTRVQLYHACRSGCPHSRLQEE